MAGPFVYLIEAPSLQLVKIGHSDDPVRRLTTIKASALCSLDLIAFWPAPRAEERELQKRFRPHHQFNEWFRLQGALAEFVESRRGMGVHTLRGGQIPAPYTALSQVTRYRDAHDLTQQALADKLKTSPGYLHDIETGRRKPSPVLAVRIEHVTGIPRSDIRPDVFASVIPAQGDAA